MSDFDIHAAAARIHHQYTARRRQALARRERAQAFGRSLARFLRAELAQDLEFIQENSRCTICTNLSCFPTR